MWLSGSRCWAPKFPGATEEPVGQRGTGFPSRNHLPAQHPLQSGGLGSMSPTCWALTPSLTTDNVPPPGTAAVGMIQ